jgi:hypothetical protein
MEPAFPMFLDNCTMINIIAPNAPSKKYMHQMKRQCIQQRTAKPYLTSLLHTSTIESSKSESAGKMKPPVAG